MREAKPNSNPAIERIMDIFAVLERAPEGLSQAAIVQQTGLARSTVYRILNSLADYRLIRETSPGSFALGGRLLELGQKVTAGSDFFSVARYLQPELEALASRVGQCCKISTYEKGAIMVVAGATAKKPHALSYTIGEYLPLHAGGASKVLMANLPKDERTRLLSRGLAALTERTVVDRTVLEAEYEGVREQGWAEDRGEYSLSVSAFAAPIVGDSGQVIAALSITFLTTSDEGLRQFLKETTIEGARQLSEVTRLFRS